MALAQYSDLFWFPNGALATGVQARVFPRASQALAPLFTDVTGTTPLPNPLTTDGSGVLTFWAEEGEYWIHIDNRSFRVSVGNPIGLDVFDGASVALSTGTLSGGGIAPAGTSVAISETVGYVVDYTTDSFRPSLTRVHVPAQNVALDGPALARTVTWWMVAANGSFVQQEFHPTNIQRRTHIVIGYSILVGGVVVFTQPIPMIEPQPMNQVADLLDALKPFNINGNVLTPAGANLMINKTSGTLFARGFNYSNDRNNPHVFSMVAQTPLQFRRLTQTVGPLPAPVTTVDPANYDVGGVITPVPGGANVSTLQRIFAFANPSPADHFVIQYGQQTYPTLAEAADARGAGTYVISPTYVDTEALIGWLAVTKSATNLSDPTQARFIRAGKFDSA